ncbi:hypothetical protein [Ferruginibacter sp. SUN106]|uniref:hypothetical protein n=1 Tax=Ferruginibacter sp. SUN106 TaxID=2978348 RepID=UPI003D360793
MPRTLQLQHPVIPVNLISIIIKALFTIPTVLQNKHTTIPAEWKMKGVSSTYLLLYCKNGTVTIQNFIE